MSANPPRWLLLALCIGPLLAGGVAYAAPVTSDTTRATTQQNSAASDESPKEVEDMPTDGMQAASAATAHAAGFTLEDQFGKSHTYQFPKEKVSVLLFADREGSEQIEGWVRSLYAKYRDMIDVDGVALLKGVPELMRGTIRFLFRKQVDRPIMMDWSGETTEQYDCHVKEASVFVIDTQGRIVFSTYGKATDRQIEEVANAVNDLLQSAGALREMNVRSITRTRMAATARNGQSNR